MSAWLQVLLDFVWVSACLALVSFSLGLILGELKIVKIAQGDLMMVGAYSMYAMRALPFVVARKPEAPARFEVELPTTGESCCDRMDETVGSSLEEVGSCPSRQGLDTHPLATGRVDD